MWKRSRNWTRSSRGSSHVADLPELVPRPRVAVERLVERGIAGGALDRALQRLADGAVARACRARPSSRRARARPRARRTPAPAGCSPPSGRCCGRPRAPRSPRKTRVRAASAISILRLARARLQRDHVGAVDPRALRVEVTALELAVAGDALVQDPPVERRHHLDPARPVLRRELPGDRRLVHAVHAHEAAAVQAGLPARSVPEAQLADDQRVAEVVARAGRRAARRRRAGTGSSPSMRSLSTSQLGRLTRSSLGTGWPPMTVVSRL